MIPDLVRELSQSESDEPGGVGLIVALLVGVLLWVMLAFLGLAAFAVTVALGYGR